MKNILILLEELHQRVTQTPATFALGAIERRRSSTIAAT
jgi:hypothetical protein